MADTPETKFKRKVLKTLRAIPGLWCVKTEQRTIAGIPDIIGCYQGRFFAFELKVPPNKVKTGSLQEHVLSHIERSGGLALEVTPSSFDEALELLHG